MTTPSPQEMHSLEGRIALVTGAGSGLGRRFASVLHTAGATVVVAARRSAPLDELVGELGDRAVALTLDLSSDESILDLVSTVKERFGDLHVLVNNAGITRVGPALDEPIEEFRELIATDLTGTYLLTRECARLMLDHGGSIVNIASLTAMVGTAKIPMASYAAAKGGLVALTIDLAAQWGQYAVRVNALSPGWIANGMGAWVNDDERGRKWLSRRTPLARVGEPHELDGALLFLASDASTFVTGQNIVVDGGWTAL